MRAETYFVLSRLLVARRVPWRGLAEATAYEIAHELMERVGRNGAIEAQIVAASALAPLQIAEYRAQIGKRQP